MEAAFSGKLPPIYKRNGRECYLDPIRKKLIYITPEETVRQSVILYLTDTLHVPLQEIISEQHLSHYGITSKKRADIVIHALDADHQSVPIAVIECKAPNVYLDMKAKEQMFEYCDLMGATYAMLTNGIDQYCFRYDAEKDDYISLTALPDYKGMLSDQYEERYPRIISGKRFFLGSIVHDRLWSLDDPDVVGLIENLISYSIVRDEYREYVKAKRN